MPKQYEAIRDKLVAKGMAYDDAQTHAAKIYNAAHPDRPVGRHSDAPSLRALHKRDHR